MRFEDYGIEIKGKKAGNAKVTCPKCGGKNCLSVNLDEGIWNCHKPSCAWKGGLAKSQPNKPQAKEFVRPVWVNVTATSDKLVKWFNDRGISQRVLNDMKITEGPEFMPQVGGQRNCIRFNYFRDGELVNIKYRDGEKNFKMVSGAEMIFYNLDAIKNADEIIIVEGEMDCLSFIEAGIQNVVSVPNGASKGSMKLEYLDNCYKYFEGAKKIILATDNDDAGMALQKELIRRLDIDKCWEIDLKDCKDANEFLLKYGAVELVDTVTHARQFPVAGVVFASSQKKEFDDLYDNGLKPACNISVPSIDKLITYELGQLTTITGIPSHGKSYWLDFVLTRLAVNYGWRIGMFSPEHYPVKLHLARLAEKLIGKRFSGTNRMNHVEKDAALEFIDKHFYFIRPDDETFSLDNILSISKSLVLRNGINALVIDPWNRLEHQLDKFESETTYISRMLDRITNFKQKNNIHVFLIAHPTKIKKDRDTKVVDVPTLYDIAGSANFFNKTDNGLTIYRDFENKTVRVYVQKIKYNHLGEIGMAEFTYNTTNGRYTELNSSEDNSSYLNKNNFQMAITPNINPEQFTEPLREYEF